MTALSAWTRITAITTPVALVCDINPDTSPVTKSILVQDLGVMRVYAVATMAARAEAFASPVKGQIVLVDSVRTISMWDGEQWQEIKSEFGTALVG